MNTDWKEASEIMKAFVEGKKIKQKQKQKGDEDWELVINPKFNWEDYDYKIIEDYPTSWDDFLKTLNSSEKDVYLLLVETQAPKISILAYCIELVNKYLCPELSFINPTRDFWSVLFSHNKDNDSELKTHYCHCQDYTERIEKDTYVYFKIMFRFSTKLQASIAAELIKKPLLDYLT